MLSKYHTQYGDYSADKGIAGPWHWNNVPKQLPGSDYDQRDYGLLEDFEIVMTK